MRPRSRVLGAAATAIVLLLATSAVAQEASNSTYVIAVSSMVVAGGVSRSETYVETGSIGQPVAGGAQTGGTSVLIGGLLAGQDGDGDGVLGASDACPTFNASCFDLNHDGCTDSPDVDGDSDGVTRGACDCNDADPTLWGRPGEVRGLRFDTRTSLAWTAPLQPGGAAPLYDVVRSDTASGFDIGTCVESNDAGDTTAADTSDPAPGRAFYYLVRAENSCAGAGPLGESRGTNPRSVRGCP